MTEHIIKRVRQVTELDRIVLAVPDSPSEGPLVDLARRMKVDVVKGPEEDVLQRFIIAGETVQADHILRVCGDNPLIDINLARSLVRHHLENNADYCIPADPTPPGTVTEMVSLKALKKIAQTTTDPVYREHVITYIHDHPETFAVEKIPAPPYLRDKTFRLTMDTEKDFQLMEKLYARFYDPSVTVVDLEKVVAYLESHPEIACLNAGVAQKDWRAEQ